MMKELLDFAEAIVVARGLAVQSDALLNVHVEEALGRLQELLMD